MSPLNKSEREEIKERANHRSELTGENTRPLVCAHFEHRRSRKNSEKFNNESNTILVTDLEHLAHHQILKKHPEYTGLATNQNNWCIYMLINECKKNNEELYNKKSSELDYLIQQKYEFAVKSWLKLMYENSETLLIPKREKPDEVVSILMGDIIIPKSYNNDLTFEDVIVRPWYEPPT